MALTLTLRRMQPNAPRLAFIVWRMPDQSFRLVRLAQAVYDAWAIGQKGVGDPPGKPAPQARFLCGQGGIPALDTPSGWPDVGDCWEADDGEGNTMLVVATGADPAWNFVDAVASDPGRGKTSRRQGRRCAMRTRVVVRDYDLGALDRLTVPVALPTLDDPIDDVIDNHRSVTFDAAASSSVNGGTSITYAHTVANQTDRYIGVGLANNNVATTVSSITYAGVALTLRLTSATFGGARVVYLYDLVAPTTGTNNVVITMSGLAQIVGGSWSAYGVDQTTPRSNTVNTTGTSAAPSGTLTSATDEVAVTVVGWRCNTGVTDTPDATWTSDWDVELSATAVGGAGSHITGAASVTRTDTLSGSNDWGIVGASLKAVAGGTVGRLVGGTLAGGVLVGGLLVGS